MAKVGEGGLCMEYGKEVIHFKREEEKEGNQSSVLRALKFLIVPHDQ